MNQHEHPPQIPGETLDAYLRRCLERADSLTPAGVERARRREFLGDTPAPAPAPAPVRTDGTHQVRVDRWSERIPLDLKGTP